MKNFWKWILGIVVVLVVFFGLGILSRLIGPQYGAYGWPHMPMMGYGIRGFGFMPFGMIFMWLVPLAFLALLVFGVLWVVKSLKGNHSSVPNRVCAQCGKPSQADWKNCPYCGNAL
jgi:hypothetical protein